VVSAGVAILGLGHVAIGVREMDRVLPFYRDIIGLRVRYDEIEVFPPTEQLPETRRRGVYLEYSDAPDAGFVVLDQQMSRAPWGEPAAMFERGLHHFALWVDDVDGIVARAAEHGVEPFVAPMTVDSVLFGEPTGRRLRSALLRDPEGNVVQVDQRLG
jgi:catechol 2,3-dioxygenase-like lactoylglutathione lyase family enzyme